MLARKPLILILLDGWGYRHHDAYNAITNAKTPQWDAWWQTYPHMLIEASGPSVGLPPGQMGNSEVGHMHIGAGRIIPQDVTRINDAIKTHAFAQNPLFIDTIESLKAGNKALHIMGLLSNGGVHSHEDHLIAFLALCSERDFSNIYLHLFLDGRDTPPKSAMQSIQTLQAALLTYPCAAIASITGRYYAMDRDQRWQRVEPVYQLLTEGISAYHFDTAEAALDAFYQQAITDEFVPPTLIGKKQVIQDGDALFFFNYRSDRARQLTQAFLTEPFDGFQRHKRVQLARFMTMTRYGASLPTDVAFPTENLQHTLGECVAEKGLTQLRLAETEKYAHVTFFLNGGSERVYPYEERRLIQSPAVATYDTQPDMSAPELTDHLIDAIGSQKYDLIVCNFANADMVGHSGNFDATVAAIECIDACLKRIADAIVETGTELLLTADHGNAECMFNETTGQSHTAHTNERVPFMYVGHRFHCIQGEGSLIDIAPTVLQLLGINPPVEMTGGSLLEMNV